MDAQPADAGQRARTRCTLHVHPDDAAAHGLADGEPAAVCSRTGTVEAPVEVTDAIMPGVVSLPHGWGHDDAGQRVSASPPRTPAPTATSLADELLVDAPSGNAVLNGIPVELAPVREPAAVEA